MEEVESVSSQTNDATIAHILSGEDIDALVSKRAQLRKDYKYEEADMIRKMLQAQDIEIVDIPHKQGGGSHWRKAAIEVAAPELLACKGVQPKSLMELAHNCHHYLTEKILSEEDIVALCRPFLASHFTNYSNHSSSDPTGSEQQQIFKLSTKREMQGRKFADAAFEFAMAGVTNSALFADLAHGAEQELKRYGHRKSCRPVDIYQVVEKIAVSGWRDQSLYRTAANMLRAKLDQGLQGSVSKQSIQALSSGEYNLLSDRPLLWLWRFASKQKKKGNQIRDSGGNDQAKRKRSDGKCSDDERENEDDDEDEGLHVLEQEDSGKDTNSPLPNFDDVFADATLPLVVDVGCGYGVSTIGLAHEEVTRRCVEGIAGLPMNYLGCDMSLRAINYAKSIALRWDLGKHCAFVYAEAGRCLEHIRQHYPGPIIWISVNFPTPYKLELVYPECCGTLGDALVVDTAEAESVANNGIDGCYDGLKKKARMVDSNIPSGIAGIEANEADSSFHGNSQLPRTLSTFMFSPNLVELCRLTLSSRKSASHYSGTLYLQSNAEDVLLTMVRLVNMNNEERNDQSILPNCSFHSSNESYVQTHPLCVHQRPRESASPLIGSRLSQRDSRWSVTHPEHRAVGQGYFSYSPLCSLARTETEVACQVEGKSVYRAMFTIG